MKKGSITVRNSIIRASAGYHFYAASGAKITVSYTSYCRAGIETRNSSAAVSLGSGVSHLDPGFLSYDPARRFYLMIDRSSPAYTIGLERRCRVGARWR